jgi:predicted O-methyltransferase YrrM
VSDLNLWSAVDAYLNEQVVGEDAVLTAATESTERAGLPQISVTPTHGKLLFLLARAIGARKILELGTLAGYSTIWLGRAVAAKGRVITLEIDAKHAAVARENFARAGLQSTIELRLGAALEILPHLADDGPFDLTFIDADKPNVPEYFEWAIRLSRPGALIIVDNVVRDGKVADEESTDPSVLGVRRLHEQIMGDDRITATTIQTVGAKGHDGFTIALVNKS